MYVSLTAFLFCEIVTVNYAPVTAAIRDNSPIRFVLRNALIEIPQKSIYPVSYN